MANELQGRRVAILLAPKGTEQVEFTDPKKAVEDAGASVDVIGVETGEVQTLVDDIDHGDKLTVEKTFSDVSPDDYDAVMVPGGTVGADNLRASEEAVRFVRAFFEAGKPVGAICHAPWVLIEADVLRGRRLTSFWTLQTDVRNAGGEWVDEEVVTDQGLVTSRYPGDLGAFCPKIVEEFAEGKHPANPGAPENARPGGRFMSDFGRFTPVIESGLARNLACDRDDAADCRSGEVEM